MNSSNSIAEFHAATGEDLPDIRSAIADAVRRALADNPGSHIYTTILAAQADRAVDALPARPPSPLRGVPVALKDNIDLAGETTSCGRRRSGDPAVVDAAIVTQLSALGAIIIGKTNLDEAALGASGRNPRFGRCHNPRHPDRLSGGSSSGSAAAVAAGHVLLAIGTDTLGSVRIPAGFCGIAGFKPTHRRLAMAGVAPLYPRFDSLGLLAAGLADMTLAAAVLLGPDEHPGPRIDSRPGVLRIGVLDEDALATVERDIAVAYRRCIEALRKSEWIEIDSAPKIDWSAIASAALWELAHEFARHSARGEPGYHDLADIDGELGSLLARAAVWPASRLASGRALLEESRSELRRWFIEADAVLTPTCPQGAPAIDGNPAKNVAAFVAPANLAGLPAISWTQGLGAEASLSLQLIGRSGEDLRLIAHGASMQSLLSRFAGNPRPRNESAPRDAAATRPSRAIRS